MKHEIKRYGRSFEECIEDGYLRAKELEYEYIFGNGSEFKPQSRTRLHDEHWEVKYLITKKMPCVKDQKRCRSVWVGFLVFKGQRFGQKIEKPEAIYKCKHGENTTALVTPC